MSVRKMHGSLYILSDNIMKWTVSRNMAVEQRQYEG